MNSSSSVRGLRAALVFPVDGEPIVQGRVRFEAGQIVAVDDSPVSRADQDDGILDLGDVAILPGLVNAHTHLEFSDLTQPLGTAGSPFPTWIRQVVAHRRGSPAPIDVAIERGLRESLLSGTTTLGEIATSDWRRLANLPTERPTTLLFWEALGPTPQAASAACERVDEFVRQASSPGGILRGLSPHAPYSVHPTLLRHTLDLSVQERLPVAMHLAESREELELIQRGTGPFRDMLTAIGAWDSSPQARLGSIDEYLQELSRAPRALVIHGNYLRATHREFLAARPDSMTLVYCPRTHAYFGHDPYPLAESLASGVSLALGTDSRASNPSLSLFEEARFVVERHPRVSPAQVLQWATLGGARALGLERSRGTLTAGKQADLAIVRLGGQAGDAPYERLFHPDARIVQTWLAGLSICST